LKSSPDAAVGADDVDTRPGFAVMLTRIEANGVRTIIVETANRLELAMLRERWIICSPPIARRPSSTTVRRPSSCARSAAA
jgi:hypothetical protein